MRLETALLSAQIPAMQPAPPAYFRLPGAACHTFRFLAPNKFPVRLDFEPPLTAIRSHRSARFFSYVNVLRGRSLRHDSARRFDGGAADATPSHQIFTPSRRFLRAALPFRSAAGVSPASPV